MSEAILYHRLDDAEKLSMLERLIGHWGEEITRVNSVRAGGDTETRRRRRGLVHAIAFQSIVLTVRQGRELELEGTLLNEWI